MQERSTLSFPQRYNQRASSRYARYLDGHSVRYVHWRFSRNKNRGLPSFSLVRRTKPVSNASDFTESQHSIDNNPTTTHNPQSEQFMTTLTINGQTHTVDAPPDMPLLW